MKKNLKIKLASVLTGVMVLTSSITFPTFAAGSINVGSASGNVGDTVTINVSVSEGNGAIGSTQGSLSYDSSALQYVGGGNTSGGGGNVNFTNAGDGNSSSLGFSVTFKILKEGSHGISGSATIYDFDENASSSSGSGSVSGRSVATNQTPASQPSNNGNSSNNSKPDDKKDEAKDEKKDEKKEEKSKNSLLKSLSVSEAKLEPEFASDVTSYLIYVPEDTKEVHVEAAAQDAKATVTVAGDKELNPGSNEVTVTVKAEDDSKTVYTITVVCGEDPAIIKSDDKPYRILQDVKDEEIPEGFTRVKEIINDTEFEVLANKDESIVLIMASSDDVERALYIYMREESLLYPYVPVAISEGNVIVILPLDQDMDYPEGLEKCVLTIGEYDFEALQGKDKDFYYVKALKADGTTEFYKYDSVENTYQRFDIKDYKVEKKDKDADKVNVVGNIKISKSACAQIIIGLSVVSIMLTIAVVVLIVEAVKHKSRRSRR